LKILQASFFWKNDKPGGLGVSFQPPAFTPEELTEMFTGKTVKDYFRDSDGNLGTMVVETYLAQLAAIAADARKSAPPLELGLIAALNILWLVDRGVLVQDEFNGYQFVTTG
jgi:hypothetical protein